jgi:hypothetical protein
MSTDAIPRPCLRCQHPTVLIRYPWGGQRVHVGTWRPWCDVPMPGQAGTPAGSRTTRVALLHAPDGASPGS